MCWFNVPKELKMIRYWITRNRLFLLLMLLPMLVQCTAAKRGTSPAPAEALQFDKGQVWQLVSLRGKEQPPAGAVVTLVLNPEAGTVNGRTQCNRYFADFSARFRSQSAEGCRYDLTFSYLGHGDVVCPDADMSAEERYFALLPKADACLLTPYTLTLMQRGKEIMKFELQ